MQNLPTRIAKCLFLAALTAAWSCQASKTAIADLGEGSLVQLPDGDEFRLSDLQPEADDDSAALGLTATDGTPEVSSESDGDSGNDDDDLSDTLEAEINPDDSDNVQSAVAGATEGLQLADKTPKKAAKGKAQVYSAKKATKKVPNQQIKGRGVVKTKHNKTLHVTHIKAPKQKPKLQITPKKKKKKLAPGPNPSAPGPAPAPGAGPAPQPAPAPAPAPASSGIDYRNPPRTYSEMPLGDTTVFVEQQLVSENPTLANKAIARLAHNRELAISAFPGPAQAELRQMKFFLLYGPKATNGGYDNGLAFFVKGSAASHAQLDTRWDGNIAVYDAENYAAISDLWALKAVAHEFGHAHQLFHWGENQPEILDTYNKAMAKTLYRNVANVEAQGQTIAVAYATTNQLEYFAELTAIFFAGGNYYPNTRTALETYDPDGAAMIKLMWGVDGNIPPPNTVH